MAVLKKLFPILGDSAPWIPPHSELPHLIRQCLGEIVGTWFLVLFGCGSVAAAVTLGAQQGLWQVAVVWGFAVTVAIYVSAGTSGAHLNPAVSLGFALFRPNAFKRYRLVPYMVAQLFGAIIAGICVYIIFSSSISTYESREGIIRGRPGSERSAMIFGEYFPNPGFVSAGVIENSAISPAAAMGIEGFGTMILTLVIAAVTDGSNGGRPAKGMEPFFIGFTVAILISLFAPLTQAGWNPARDFGPRIIAAATGWGDIAIPGPRNGFWVYIVGPFWGAPLGFLLYDLAVKPQNGAEEDDEEATELTETEARYASHITPKHALQVSMDKEELQRLVTSVCKVCTHTGEAGYGDLTTNTAHSVGQAEAAPVVRNRGQSPKCCDVKSDDMV